MEVEGGRSRHHPFTPRGPPPHSPRPPSIPARNQWRWRKQSHCHRDSWHGNSTLHHPPIPLPLLCRHSSPRLLPSPPLLLSPPPSLSLLILNVFSVINEIPLIPSCKLRKRLWRLLEPERLRLLHACVFCRCAI